MASVKEKRSVMRSRELSASVCRISLESTLAELLRILSTISEQSKKIEFWKELTTPDDPVAAVIAGLKRVP